MRWLHFLAFTSSIFYYCNCDDTDSDQDTFIDRERTRRQLFSLPLVYPYGSTIRLIMGLTSPVPSEDHISLVFGASFLYQYIQFMNITELSMYYAYNTISRDQRSIDFSDRINERKVFYEAVEEMLNVKGYNGRHCVLRAICEAAQFPVSDEGLVGEIMHILLTPNYGRTQLGDNQDSDSNMAEYVNAYSAGRQMFSCPYIYDQCPEGNGILELVTSLRDD